MGSRVRRLVAAITPVLPVLVILAGFAADGAKRWR